MKKIFLSFFLVFFFLFNSVNTSFATDGTFTLNSYDGTGSNATGTMSNFSPSLTTCYHYSIWNSSNVNVGGDNANATFSCDGTNFTTVNGHAHFPDGNYYIIIKEDEVGTNTWTSQTFHLENDLFSLPQEVKIVVSPSAGSKTVGAPFVLNVAITSAEAFNAARAAVAVSSNLSITGIHNPTSNACNLQYTQTPTTSNPSFAGAIYGGSSTSCTLYTLTLTPTSTGTGTVTFTNGSVKSYADNSEILTGVENGSFTISNGSTPTPTPLLEFQITNPLQTYKTNFDLTGTKLSSITHMFVNGDDGESTYPTSTTWSVPVTLTLGANNFTLYGSDDEENQTATQTITVNRHTLGDINGDGNVDLIDASLFAVDWDKTSGLTYNLSDMNDDGVVDLTDLSILAKLIE